MLSNWHVFLKSKNTLKLNLCQNNVCREHPSLWLNSCPLALYPHLFFYRLTCGNVRAVKTETSSPPHLFISPSVCFLIPPLRLSHNPSISISGVLLSPCVPPYICLSTCKTLAGSYLSAWVCGFVCVFVLTLHPFGHYFLMYMCVMICISTKKRWFQRCVFGGHLVSYLLSQEWREESALRLTTSQKMQTLTTTVQSTSYVSQTSSSTNDWKNALEWGNINLFKV